MDGAKIDSEYRCRESLEAVFARVEGDRRDNEILAEARRLYLAGLAAVEDSSCREYLDYIELYATELCAELDRAESALRVAQLEESLGRCLATLQARLAAIAHGVLSEEAELVKGLIAKHGISPG